jgi:hypothetical protein
MSIGPRIIPYGCARVPDDATGPRAIAQVTVDPARRRPLRLNDAGWQFAEAPDPARLGDPVAALDFLREETRRLCDPWAAHQGRFVDAYFGLVARQVAREAQHLAARLAPFGDLYRVADFGFSALRPLPRAHVGDDAGWIAVDFAFWTGDALVAVDIIDGRRTMRRRAADHARLGAAGADVVALAPEILAGDAPDLAAYLPAPLVGFSDGEPLPSSPFKAAALGDILDADR